MIDHEIEIKASLMPSNGGLNVAWARQHLRNFAEYSDAINEKVAEEKRYHDEIGYCPRAHDDALRAAARRAYEKHCQFIRVDIPRLGMRNAKWDELTELMKHQWEEIAKAVIG